MMSNADIVLKVMGKIETGNMREASVNLADDFIVRGLTPDPLRRDDFFALMQGLLGALPDWRFNIRDMREEGNTVRMELHMTGTNTGAIDIPALGLRGVPATGKRVTLPEESVAAVFRDGRIAVFRFTPVPGGGIRGVFEQLDIVLPELVYA
jgi:predicted ester cyclase